MNKLSQEDMEYIDKVAIAVLQGMYSNPDYTAVNESDLALTAYRVAYKMFDEKAKYGNHT